MPNISTGASPGAPADDIELASLWKSVRTGLKGLGLTAVAVGALTYGVLSLMAPRYSAESQLEFTAKRNNPFPEGEGRPSATDTSSRIDQPAINTHARALLSSDLLLKVANDLKLRNRAEFNSALGPVDIWGRLLRIVGIGGPLPGETEEERVLATIRRQLEVGAVKDTRFIAIRFNSTDARLAADFANLLADTYRGGLVALPVQETTRAVEALLPKIEQLRREVLEAEAAVERYRATSGQFRSGPQGTPIADQRMAGLQDELLKVEAARNEADARWRTARELMRSGSAEVLPDVQKSQLIQSLIQQRVRLERQIAETSASLLPGHPRMQQLAADVAGLRRQITAEVEKVVQSIEKDARSAAIRVENVTRQIDALKSKVVGDSGNEARLKELQSVASAKRTELDRLQKQLEDNRTVINIKQVPIEAQVVAQARPSATPVFPKKGATAALASAATLILGMAFLITKALVSGTGTPTPQRKAPPRGAVQQREPVFDIPGVDPSQGPTPAKASTARPAAPERPDVTKALGDLVDRLLARTDTHSGVRSLVTADGRNRTAQQQARQLAAALAAAGKTVVLIDWNPMGRPTQQGKAGMTDLIRGTAMFDAVIVSEPGTAYQFINAGSPQSDRTAILDPDRLNLTLDALDEAYDQIVVMAEHANARELFEVIEGRFDAAVLLTADPLPAPKRDGTVAFLGYEVQGIDVVHVPPPNAARHAMPRTGSATALQATR